MPSDAIRTLYPTSSPTFRLSTDAIESDGRIDPRYSYEFDNSSPELHWEGEPPETRGYALIAEDPDAPNGLFTHWLVYRIPPEIHHLPAGLPAQDTLPNGIRQGLNGFGKLGYAGPYPPLGAPAHHYIFRIFALSRQPEIRSRATRDVLLAELSGLILTSAEVQGVFRRVSGQRAG